MLDQHTPLSQFTEQRLINETLSNASLVGSPVERVGGTRFAQALGKFTLLGGAGSVRFIVEGTLDGSNWFVLASTTATTDFTASGQALLNEAGSGQIDLQRVQLVRTRASIESGAPVFTLLTEVTAIARAGEAFDIDDTTFTRSGAVPTTQVGSTFPRPAGTVFANCQITASGVNLDGATAFVVALQGTLDGGNVWQTIGTVSVTADGSSVMQVDSQALFSLDSYAYLRFAVVDSGVAGGAAAFQIDTYLGLDSSDWISSDGSSGGSSFDPTKVFVAVLFTSPSAEVLNTRAVGFQLVDATGNPISDTRLVELIVYDTSLAGDLDLAANATFTAVAVGSAISGIGTNRLTMQTNASGQGLFSVTDPAVETTYLTAVNPTGPALVPQYIAKAAQVPLSYT